MLSQMVKTFTDRYPFVGPVFWILSIQYYLVQLVVALAWSPPYGLSSNTISDLGNTTCGTYSMRLVCSPLHGLMNTSFIILGLAMVIGAELIYQEFKDSLGSLVGFAAMAAAGIGTLLVGIFPENSVSSLHFLGALLALLVGNLGLVVLGISLDIPRSLRVYTIASGSGSLVALELFANHTYLGLGLGGMERLAAYPQTMWLIVFGLYISRDHMRRLVTAVL